MGCFTLPQKLQCFMIINDRDQSKREVKALELFHKKRSCVFYANSVLTNNILYWQWMWLMTLKTMMTVPWWRASRTRLGETILISHVQICIKHISKQFILKEYYLLDMMNDLILTTISVIFFMQYHIYFLDQMLPTIKFTGERKINTNNKQPLNKGCP